MVIDYSDDQIVAHIEPHRETIEDAVNVGILVNTYDPEGKLTSAKDQILFYSYFIDCVGFASGAIVIDGKSVDVSELTFESFKKLPSALVSAWKEGVKKANPSFSKDQPEATKDGDKEKKSA